MLSYSDAQLALGSLVTELTCGGSPSDITTTTWHDNNASIISSQAHYEDSRPHLHQHQYREFSVGHRLGAQ
jgi:hypothetical protein